MTSGTLVWRVRTSLLTYMMRDPSFSVATSGSGSFEPSTGVSLPVFIDTDGTVRASGSVVLSAHEGALLVPLVELEMTQRVLSIRDPFVTIEDARQRLALVSVEPIARCDSSGVTRYTTRLSADGALLFMNYAAGTEFADLDLRIDLDEKE